jgi:tetratricopeptide (TPR) repeat protein
MGPKDPYFTKGNKNSATVDLRDTASGQLAVEADKATPGENLGKSKDKEALSFYKPGDKVSPAQKSAGQAGMAPGKPIPFKRMPTSRKAELLLDSLQYGNRDWKKSRKYLVKLVEANPKDQDALAALQNLDTAEALATRLEHPKTNQNYQFYILHDFMGKKLVESILKHDGKIYDKLGRPIGVSAKAKALHTKLKDQATALTAKGLMASHRGDYLKERAYYQQALALTPGDSSIKSVLESTQKTLDDEAEKLLAKGLMAGWQGNALEEMKLYRQAQIRKPTDHSINEVIASTQKTLDDEAHALSIKGIEVSRSGDDERALVYFKQALLRRPFDGGIKEVITDMESKMAATGKQKSGK